MVGLRYCLEPLDLDSLDHHLSKPYAVLLLDSDGQLVMFVAIILATCPSVVTWAEGSMRESQLRDFWELSCWHDLPQIV